MGFKLPFKISRYGVIFTYKNDRILWRWPKWKYRHGPQYHSYNHNLDFSKFSEYKARYSKLESANFKKLSGFDYPDILSQWVSMKYPFDNVIILMNINVQEKNIQFWAKVPQTEIQHFLKDVVVLRCKDKTEMERLIGNISQNFAEAYAYSAGSLVMYNKEEYL